MNVSPIQSSVDTSTIPIEDLAGNQHLTEQQKIAEASRQFEAIMLRQILSESQKPVIKSEFTDNSTAAGIYQDYITNALADSMSKAGTLGLAKVFDQQLSHPAPKTGLSGKTIIPPASQKPEVAVHPEYSHRQNLMPVSTALP